MALSNSQTDLADNLDFVDFKLELEFLRDYCYFMKNNFKAEINSISDIINKEGLSSDIEYYAYFIGEVFPFIHWSSMFVVAFGLFEKILSDICIFIRYIYKPKFEINDIKGKGIKKYSLYIKRVIDCNEIFNTKNWNKINDYKEIRNILIHNDGEFNRNNEKFFNIIKKYKEVIIGEHDNDLISIKIDKNIVFSAIDEYCHFVFDLDKAIREILP